MSDDNTVEVRFTANTENFDIQIDSVARSLGLLRDQAAGLSSQMAASSAGPAAFTSALKSAQGAAQQVSGGLQQTAVSAQAVSGSFASGGGGVSFYTRELRALGDEMASGRWHQFDGTMVNLAVHGYQSAASFAAMNPVVTGFGVAALAAAAALAEIAIQSHAANEAMEGFKTATDLSGLRVTTADMESIIAEMIKFSGTGKLMSSMWTSTAGEVVASYGAMRNGGEPVIRALSLATEDLAEMMRVKPPEAAKVLAKAFDDPARSGRQLINELTGLTVAQRAQIESAIQSGSILAAQTAMMQGLTSAVESHVTRRRDEAAALAASMAHFDGLNAGLTEGEAMERFIARAVTEATSAFDAEINRVNALTAALGALAPTARQIGDEVRSFTEKFDPASVKIATLTAQIATMQDLQSKTTDKGQTDNLTVDIAKASDELKKLQDRAADGLLGRTSLAKTEEQIKQIDQLNQGSRSSQLKIELPKVQADASNPNLDSDSRQKAAERASAMMLQIRDAEFEEENAKDSERVTAAGKNSAQIIAIRQQEVNRATAIYGAGNAKTIAAEEQLSRAKEQAANRGAADDKKSFDQRKKAIDDAIEAEMEATKRAADERQISREQELAQLLSFQKRKEAIEGLKTDNSATQAILSQEEQILSIRQTSSSKQEKITSDVTRKMVEDYKSAYSQIASQAASDLNSMIWGHETLRQFAAKMAEQMTGDAIKQGFQKLAASLAVNQAEVQANAAKNSTMVSQDATGGASSSAVQGTAMAASIKGSAAETYAGVFGFLSPIMGPLAAVPAAAAEGLVMAKNVLLPSFDVGTDMITRSGMAMVHEGETIKPATSTGPYTGNGGGSVIHFHINAIDAQGVAQFISANAGTITKVVTGQQNANISMRGKW